MREFYPRPIEKVWAALTDSEALADWLMANDFEPRVGRRFTFHSDPIPGWRGRVDCEVVALEPPSRMVWCG
ncbi:MAG: SRPBCC family protein, partial [Stellaceae bacterium]